MKTTWIFGLACAAVLGGILVSTKTATAQTVAQPKGGTPTAPLAPAGPCLMTVNKMGQGTRTSQMGAPYQCPTGPTRRGPVRLKITLRPENCDQTQNMIPPGSVLEADGQGIMRNDTFAYFTGKFRITNPAGVVIFTGEMDTVDRVSTHTPPLGPDKCDRREFLEGWLKGAGQGPAAGFRISAPFAAKCAPMATPNAPITMILNGSVMK